MGELPQFEPSWKLFVDAALSHSGNKAENCVKGVTRQHYQCFISVGEVSSVSIGTNLSTMSLTYLSSSGVVSGLKSTVTFFFFGAPGGRFRGTSKEVHKVEYRSCTITSNGNGHNGACVCRFIVTTIHEKWCCVRVATGCIHTAR